MFVGRFFIDAWQRGKTHYAVTNQRIIILSGIFSTSIESLDLKTLPPVTLSEKSNGRGSVAFGQPTETAPVGFKNRQLIQPPSFDSIENARNVFQIIRNAQQAN